MEVAEQVYQRWTPRTFASHSPAPTGWGLSFPSKTFTVANIVWFMDATDENSVVVWPETLAGATIRPSGSKRS